ncbi:MAG: FAD-dependent oxidoreductase [Bacillota bacterium]|nr:FAD-dependent oxidoreductase [Bacillota bacterium]
MYDIVIVGAGPAGLTAAIYARRADKSVLVIEKENFGGQITYSPKVENYPGSIQISGGELAEKFVEQALNLGAEIEMDTVLEIKNGDLKTIVGENGSYEAKSVILATGSKHRQLGLQNENDLIGNGVSYCAVCDGAFYNTQTVAVIGGGNTALQDAVLLSDMCKKVILIQNLDFFTGESTLLSLLGTKKNVEFITGCVVEKLFGDTHLSAISIKNTSTGKIQNLDLDGIFVAIGQQPENEKFSDFVSLDEYGYIVADESCLTGTDGIFAAGDCRVKGVRQVATAVADGAVSALAACRYVDNLNYSSKNSI